MQRTAKEVYNRIKSTKDKINAIQMLRDPEERKKLIQEGISFYTGRMLSSAKNSIVNYLKR